MKCDVACKGEKQGEREMLTGRRPEIDSQDDADVTVYQVE